MRILITKIQPRQATHLWLIAILLIAVMFCFSMYQRQMNQESGISRAAVDLEEQSILPSATINLCRADVQKSALNRQIQAIQIDNLLSELASISVIDNEPDIINAINIKLNNQPTPATSEKLTALGFQCAEPATAADCRQWVYSATKQLAGRVLEDLAFDFD